MQFMVQIFCDYAYTHLTLAGVDVNMFGSFGALRSIFNDLLCTTLFVLQVCFVHARGQSLSCIYNIVIYNCLIVRKSRMLLDFVTNLIVQACSFLY